MIKIINECFIWQLLLALINQIQDVLGKMDGAHLYNIIYHKVIYLGFQVLKFLNILNQTGILIKLFLLT
jgi:hypothetical protein